MTRKSQNAKIYAGDTTSLEFTCTDDTGRKNLNGATVSWKMAKHQTDNSASVLVTKTTPANSGITITHANNGLFEVVIPASNTTSLKGSYFHEARITDSNGQIATVATGTLTITPTLH